MDKKNGGLGRLCKVYEKLDDGDKEKVIRLAEELLNTQNTNDNEKKPLKKENFRTKFTDLDNGRR
jgi:hypothetical protein